MATVWFPVSNSTRFLSSTLLPCSFHGPPIKNGIVGKRVPSLQRGYSGTRSTTSGQEVPAPAAPPSEAAHKASKDKRVTIGALVLGIGF